jgi:hypothetical protein
MGASTQLSPSTRMRDIGACQRRHHTTPLPQNHLPYAAERTAMCIRHLDRMLVGASTPPSRSTPIHSTAATTPHTLSLSSPECRWTPTAPAAPPRRARRVVAVGRREQRAVASGPPPPVPPPRRACPCTRSSRTCRRSASWHARRTPSPPPARAAAASPRPAAATVGVRPLWPRVCMCCVLPRFECVCVGVPSELRSCTSTSAVRSLLGVVCARAERCRISRDGSVGWVKLS